MADEPKTHEEQMRERAQAAEKERAEAEAKMTPEEREAAGRDMRTNNRAQGSGRENTAIPEHTREAPPPSEEGPFGANPLPPRKILNIDGAGNGDGVSWMDFSEPAPMELIQAIYDNSKDGPVTIWSRHLAESNFSSLLWNWLMEGDAAWRSRTLAMQLWEPPTEVPPQGSGMVNFTPPTAKARPATRSATSAPASPTPSSSQATQARRA